MAFALPSFSLGVLALSSSLSHSAILAQYEFTSSGDTFASGPTAAGVVASTLGTGAGLTGNTAGSVPITAASSGVGNPASSLIVRIGGTADSAANAVTQADYRMFTVTPSAGMVLNLTSLTLDTANTRSTTTNFTGTVFVRSSLDGFGSNLGSWTQLADSTTSTWNPRTIALTGSAYQNITAPVEFRLYFYDDSDSTADAAAVHRVDNIVLNGTVTAVPEPQVATLLALSMASLLWRRRR